MRMMDGMKDIQLTPRESEIFVLIRSGLSYPQIGERLGISVNTVHAVAARLRIKLKVRTRAEMQALKVKV